MDLKNNPADIQQDEPHQTIKSKIQRSVSQFLRKTTKRYCWKWKNSVYEPLDTDQKRWKFINETRGSIKTSPSIKLLNFFGELIIDKNNKANFVNYRSFFLESYFGPSRPHSNNLSAVNLQPEFSFEPISEYTCMKVIKALKINKPTGPWCIPTLAPLRRVVLYSQGF